MKNSKIKIPFSFLLLILFLCSPGFAQELRKGDLKKAGISVERLLRLEGVFQRYVADEDMAGSVVMVARRGKVVYRKAFGFQDRESGAVMQVNTIFRIASQTKALVSLGVMILQEEGGF